MRRVTALPAHLDHYVGLSLTLFNDGFSSADSVGFTASNRRINCEAWVVETPITKGHPRILHGGAEGNLENDHNNPLTATNSDPIQS